MRRLTGPELKELRDIVRQAFRLSRFDRLLSGRLDISREDIALGSEYDEILFKVLDDANRNGWLTAFVKAASAENPSDSDLADFANRYYAVGVVAQRSDLEKIVDSSNEFLDIAKVIGRLSTIYRQVCRISFGGGADPQGSGFLVGPSVVLTNNHVMKSVIDEQVDPTHVRAQFDYAVLPDGTIDNGTRVELADDWLIDTSAYTQNDVNGTGPPPTSEELDYAFIRLKRPLGNEPIGTNPTPDAPARGWIDLAQHAPIPAVDTPIAIVQHPRGDPMKLAWASKSVIGLNEKETRLRHRTNTQGGSSGSPTFDVRFGLVALHQGSEIGVTATYNQGVPVAPIIALLKKRQKYDVLSS